MFKKIKIFLVIFFITVPLSYSYSKNFDLKIDEIRKEIIRDDLNSAINLLKKIKIQSDNEQEKIDLLFGDIYLKINKLQKAESYYQKTFFTSDEKIESLTFVGLAEIRLLQGKLKDAINYSEKSIKKDNINIRPKLILAIAKTRIGDVDEGIKILNDLYNNRKDADVALAISDYYSSFDNNKKSINILEDFIKRDPNNIKVLNQLASLHLMEGNKEKAIEYKFIVFKYFETVKNRKRKNEAKSWILSVDPNYFDKALEIKKKEKEKQKEYQEEEISEYEKNKIKPHYEEFAFAPNAHGSGFIVGNGKFVITNFHVIEGAKRIAVRNGIGKVTEAEVAAISKDYDLAILKLKKPYPKKFSINSKDFVSPKAGDDVISIGYPGIGITFEQPTITQGIISKVFDDKYGIFLTTAAINSGNSGGPIFNLNGKLVGVSFATLDKKKFLEEEGQIPSDMGYAIKSDMIKEVFAHKKGIPVKSVKYDKVQIYEKMLPSIALVVVDLGDKK